VNVQDQCLLQVPLLKVIELSFELCSSVLLLGAFINYKTVCNLHRIINFASHTGPGCVIAESLVKQADDSWINSFVEHSFLFFFARVRSKPRHCNIHAPFVCLCLCGAQTFALIHLNPIFYSMKHIEIQRRPSAFLSVIPSLLFPLSLIQPRAENRREVAPGRSVTFDSARSADFDSARSAALILISRAARALTPRAARSLIPRAARRGFDSARSAGFDSCRHGMHVGNHEEEASEFEL